jgi:hypothetical protein
MLLTSTGRRVKESGSNTDVYGFDIALIAYRGGVLWRTKTRMAFCIPKFLRKEKGARNMRLLLLADRALSWLER